MEFTPEVALAIFFAKLIDPIPALPAVVAGYFCRTWWQVVIAAAAGWNSRRNDPGIIPTNDRNSPRATLDGRIGGRRMVQPSFCFQNLAR
jgi:hypothetical protein